MSDSRTIRDTFNRVAARYDRHAALELEVGRRLLERTDFCRREPRRILDLGCGTGACSVELKKKFRRARVIGVDSATMMLAQLRRRASLLRPVSVVCADLSSLPFPQAAADLVFCNLAAYWSPDPGALFGEFRRVLQPGGMLLFSTLGPASLRELREASFKAGSGLQFPEFPDLLEVGNALVAAGFSEPVMDMEIITVHYPSLDALALELESTGTSLLISGGERWAELRSSLDSTLVPREADGKFPLTYEIVYGTAFGPEEGQPRRTADGDIATFSVESLLRSRRLG
jgi:malonyl-CoA O-methyltransferase